MFIEVNETNKLAELFEKSKLAPVILFKHSVSCPISTDLYDEVSQLKDEEVHLVIVQKARLVSNEIEEKTGIRHESPQAIVLRNGKVIYSAAHYDITANDIKTATEV